MTDCRLFQLHATVLDMIFTGICKLILASNVFVVNAEFFRFQFGPLPPTVCTGVVIGRLSLNFAIFMGGIVAGGTCTYNDGGHNICVLDLYYMVRT